MGTLEPIEVQRGRCEACRDLLRDLTRIHLEIDAPTREVGADEPEWVFRLRKVCLHTIVISACAVHVDGMHTMTTELRAAYEQMAVVWECMPDGFRFAEDGSWWVSEAKDRLAEFNHPTAFSLAMSLAHGGFDDAGAPDSLPASRRVVGPAGMRIRASTRLSGASPAHRRGRRFPSGGANDALAKTL